MRNKRKHQKRIERRRKKAKSRPSKPVTGGAKVKGKSQRGRRCVPEQQVFAQLRLTSAEGG